MPNSTAGAMHVAVAVLALAGCAAQIGAPEDGEEQAVSGSQQALSLTPGIRFTELPAPAGQPELRVLIKDAAQYRALFKAAPPAGVDFRRGDALIFYSAGERRTGGFRATIQSIVQGGSKLRVTTRLESPGPDCLVTQSISNPRVMVKFKRPAGVSSARFVKDDTRRDCGPRSCNDVTCPGGQRCELQKVVCVRAPCDPVPTCVDDRQGPGCGGFAGAACPGAGTCVDDPSDDCDPQSGGADCGGLCKCDAPVSCSPEMIFDPSPEVCGCVPLFVPGTSCATMPCLEPGTICLEQDGQPTCVPLGPDVPTPCGLGTCDAGQVCCNWSCGICTRPDGVCIQSVCDRPVFQ